MVRQMESKTSKDVSEELSCALSHLRWILTGIKMGGIELWPLTRPAALSEPCEPCERREPGHPGEVRGQADSREPGAPCAAAGGVEPAAGTDSPTRLDSIREELGDCRRCRLAGGRTHLVFGDGSPASDLVFVGEGPGFDEDRQGLPFVGRAGMLLNAMIRALGMAREEVYICNVVKCRPPGNRTPNPDEIEACSRFLFQQLSAIRPRVICALGACAAQTLLGSTAAISRLRGKVHQWRGTPLVCTYHPAYLLRTPAQKALVWQDLLQIRRLLQTGRPPT
jgi:DNA polymerase